MGGRVTYLVVGIKDTAQNKCARMSDKTKEETPQAGYNPAGSSDRVKASVAAAGPTDSGEGQPLDQAKNKWEYPASTQEPKTGEETHIDLTGTLDRFCRRDSIRRTPPKNSRKTGNNGEISELQQGKESPNTPNTGEKKNEVISPRRRCMSVGSIKKRKVDDRDIGELEDARIECPVAFMIMEAVATITKQTEALEKIVAANNNTKKEIKELTEKLKKQISLLNRDKVKKWFDGHKYVMEEATVPQNKGNAIMKDAETQSTPWKGIGRALQT